MAVAALRFLSSTFPALTHRNFRLFWTGQCVSLVGTWMQNIGQAWLVLGLTGSPLKLGLVYALQWLPVLLLSFLAGPLVDRFPKRRILLATQAALMLLALALALLVWSGRVQYWHVLVLAALLGLVNTVDSPTRQAYVIELAGREHLLNAISLNSTIFNLARMVDPAVAGLLIAAVGLAPCFFLNSASFLAVMGALTRLDLPDRAGAVPVPFRDYGANILEGLRYAAAHALILWPIVLVGLLSLFVINYSVVIPVFVRVDLRRGPEVFGLLMTALGMSVFSALVGLHLGLAMTCLCLALAGYCQITCTAQINATLQMQAPDALRGRVMSLYNLAFGGVTPVGSLYAGALVAGAGARVDLLVSGAAGLAAAALCAYGLRRVLGGGGAPA